ncbi:uncharacterized protein [Nicotiana tomentosiformis]|uniref:uncharacterized protein n=1 Tax=Nicotiana tomentosiformis TaxID=4098 RepID=UPI00051B991D|nr:uncharacterized protein LOC108942774 [Nicotiana tomentosiformis]XP_018630212.1 uncharacterized protein LOC108942774 [Nicotiana tomentosiformis]XP_018630213.1 uncharacterized protein LOC108942774 [Nicotiana tomentosiformis]XP_018630214.1 uncharacterized protein LOC108942774 [Nicotiana tomentosiformis]
MQSNNKDLLHLEAEALPLESKLLFCNRDAGIQSQNLKPDKKPDISSVPKSQVLSKIKDFLGVLSEDNKNLELAAKNNPQKYDIEALTGQESEYIEMDIVLGVAELHTQEAVSAAESAIAGYQPVINLATSDNDSESEDRSDEDEISDRSSDESSDDEDGASAVGQEKDSSKKAVKRKRQSENRANIVELS